MHAPEPYKNVAVVVLDGIGCGSPADVVNPYPEDAGAHSLLHTSERLPLAAHALQEIGLELVPGCEDVQFLSRVAAADVVGAYGALHPNFQGKGSPEGHMALMGYENQTSYEMYDETGFSPLVIDIVEAAASGVMEREVRVLRRPEGDSVSGTTFMHDPRIGMRHVESASEGVLLLPAYTSTDSVVQLMAHEGVISQLQLEDIGRRVRSSLDDASLRVGRVIIRPFHSLPDGSFARLSAKRRDYGLDPDGPTVIDALEEVSVGVHSAGKAASMLNKRGFDVTNVHKLDNDPRRALAVLDHFANSGGFMFANLTNTDEKGGHRRNPLKYWRLLAMYSEMFGDAVLPKMGRDDLIIFASDHGNDPTFDFIPGTGVVHTNHTWERTPVLAWSPRMLERPQGDRAINLGVRSTFADVAATVAQNYAHRGVQWDGPGTSFFEQIG